MLFRAATLASIAKGEVSLAFRVWDSPRAKAGGRHRTPVGELRIDSVDPVTRDDVTEADARAAGFATRDALLAEPMLSRPGTLWRVAFTLNDDPRVALREAVPTPDEAQAALAKLDRMRARARFDPFAHLALIAESPGTRAGELASSLGLETQTFKRQVRRLKDLGLTESLSVGYRLSPRGQAILAAHNDRA